MLNTKLIAFMGPIGSGKTLAADYLVKKGYIKLNFKDALIREVKLHYPMLLAKLSSKYGLTIEDLFLKPYPDEIRCLLQDHGKLRRDEYRGYWVGKWDLKYDPTKDFAVDDCRFPEEFDRIKELRGYIIRIDRPGIKDTSTHESEKYQRTMHPDAIVTNNGSKSDLYKSLDNIIEHL